MVADRFREIFGADPEVSVRAPGRVNLIGEHTDYNEGFVLPAAIDRHIEFAGRRRSGRTVRVYALDFNDSAEFSLDLLARGTDHTWTNYLQGICQVLEATGRRLSGADLVFGGNVPRESGLSSSAAVEVGSAAFWRKLLTLDVEPVELVRLAQRAENDFVGVPSGIMDQFVSALGQRDHAIFIDCRSLDYRRVPLSESVKIVVCNSGVKRALAQSEYQARVEQCRQAVAEMNQASLRIKSLRDATWQDLARVAPRMSDIPLRRARHVISENERVETAVQALEAGDLETFGRLMNASHVSLRDDYAVSCRELDTLVEFAWKQPGTLGARMTGAGFGGCTVNLVRCDAAQAFAEAVREGYRAALGLKAEVYICQASDGALIAA